MQVGSGRFTYEVAVGWGTLPEGWRLGQTAAVCTDSADRVYVFHRPPGDEPTPHCPGPSRYTSTAAQRRGGGRPGPAATVSSFVAAAVANYP